MQKYIVENSKSLDQRIMLESITLKNVATYDATGVQVSSLKKINFIYGANGCGKTTLTKFICTPSDAIYSSCVLSWKNELPVKALVYNKDFRDRNFGKGKMDGVFTLGQATKEDIASIDKMQADLQIIKTDGIKKKETLEKQQLEKTACEEEFRNVAWSDIYKENEDDFKTAFAGFLRKEAFKEKILDEFVNNVEPLQTYEELKEKAVVLFGETPTIMSTLGDIDFTHLLDIEKNKIWKKKILGKADVEIASLIQKLNLNDWVNEGRSYLQDDETCPFCQQKTITESFRKQIENYFDESFTKDIATIKSLSEEYSRLSQNLLNALQQIEAAEKGNSKTKLNLESFSVFIKTAASQFISNTELLNTKTKEPSRSIELVSTKEQLEDIQGLVTSCNVEIKNHNDIVNDYTNQRSKLIQAIWKYLIESHRASIEAYNKKIDGLDKGIAALAKQQVDSRTRYTELDKKIKEANKNVTSVQPSVDEINRVLKSYGFLNFEIVPSKTEANQYQIQRQDGTIAESTLSEGEASFITFLYFLQLAKGSTEQESITEERILVVDDPISSLDSNVLFVVSSMIKEIIKAIKENQGNIKQLILLTHNVYFHKEVSFIDGRTKKEGNTNFWILRRNNNTSSIQAFGMDNPIQNSYELLWRELSNTANKSSITTQNIMRRIIENYFKILGKFADDDLIKSFDNRQEQEICRSLVCWINDGSHSIPDDLYIEQQDATTDKYFDVFKKVFVQMRHEEHYNMMFSEPELL